MNVLNKILVLGLSISQLLSAKSVEPDVLDIHKLLTNIEKKTDLSQKTKLANGGISFIYTRDDLDRMQVRYLKDILKSTYPAGYKENSMGISDPMTTATKVPFLSSMMRVFIDNQEISTGLYGSGIIILGNIDIGFVDHIEIYTQNPSYEFSTESTFILVKLYSKSVQKDEGSKVGINAGTYGSAGIRAQHAEDYGSWSYYNYISSEKIGRDKPKSHDTELSRDKKRTHILSSIKKDDNNILIEAIKTNADSFLAYSMDATPLKDEYTSDYLHIGYDTLYKNFSFLMSYDFMKTNSKFLDDKGMIKSLNIKVKSHVYTSELKYNYETPHNRLIAGIKARLKKYDYTYIEKNGMVSNNIFNDTQSINTVFVENQYSLKSNSIITTGISASKVLSNHSDQDDNLLMYRVGHTYTDENYIFKTVGSHVEITIDPYLIGSKDFYIVNKKIDVQKVESIVEDIIYQKANNKYELMLTYMTTENYLMLNNRGLLDNYNKKSSFKSILTRWTHQYNDYDKFFVTMAMLKRDNIPIIKHKEEKRVVLRNINTYAKFDIFNELLYARDSINKKSYYDYSAGVKYHHSNDLIISLKGENLLNKAPVMKYGRINPTTFQKESPLEVAPIDRKITVEFEYLF